MSLQENYGCLHALLEDWSLNQPPMKNLHTFGRYCNELVTKVYLSGLQSSITSQICGLVLYGSQV